MRSITAFSVFGVKFCSTQTYSIATEGILIATDSCDVTTSV